MMQVKEVSNQGLKREYAITVECAHVEKLMTDRLEKISKTANIQGFRPGKAPLSMVRQRYGASVRSEVLDETVSETTTKTLTERNLRPAVQPQVELVSFGEGKDLEFKLAVEVLPEITLKDFGAIKLSKPVAEASEAEIDKTIMQIAKQMAQPTKIEKDRPAQMGDTAVIDFDGSVDGERQPGMLSEGYALELGSKSFIDTFEEQIVGMKIGQTKDIKVKFPDAYQAPQLAGKQAVFIVKLNELRERAPIELNDETAKGLGMETLADLRKRVAEDLNKNYARVTQNIVKRELMDKLAEAYDFAVPATLAESEFSNIWAQVEQSKKMGQLPADEAKKSDDELKKDYRKIAERRIRLGLLLSEVARVQKLVIGNNEMRDAMMAEARRYPGQEQAVINYYTQTEGALDRLKAQALEEKSVSWLIEQSKVTEKKMSAEELEKLSQADDEE